MIDQRIVTALGLRERDGKVALVNHNVQTKLATSRWREKPAPCFPCTMRV
jgi:hypothetical protein